ncbi:MAG: hypothetical protein IID00_00810 [Chloroflexi bacterium]|nr:hypothetical protein [Chloroflexota bacterium]
MAIEVKQMVIKSTVLSDGVTESTGAKGTPDIDDLLSQIREECRRMIIDILRRERER